MGSGKGSKYWVGSRHGQDGEGRVEDHHGSGHGGSEEEPCKGHHGPGSAQAWSPLSNAEGGCYKCHENRLEFTHPRHAQTF